MPESLHGMPSAMSSCSMRHDFGVVCLANQFFQAGPHRIRRIAGVQALDDSLQGAHALCPVVN
jgi:hypothetical protein